MVVRPDGNVMLEPGIAPIVIAYNQRTTSAADWRTISMEIKITNAEVNQVQRFLWDLAEHTLLKRFDFAATQDSTTSLKPKIGVSDIDSHLAIVNSTIKLLQGENIEKAEPIATYLLEWFPEHLKFLLDKRDQMSPHDIGVIGKAVYNLFDESTINRHWKHCCEAQWYLKSSVKTFLRWLKDSNATSDLSNRDHKWLQKVHNSDIPSRTLLAPFMHAIAKLWLQGTQGDAVTAWTWINGFLLNINTVRRKRSRASVGDKGSDNTDQTHGDNPSDGDSADGDTSEDSDSESGSEDNRSDTAQRPETVHVEQDTASWPESYKNIQEAWASTESPDHIVWTAENWCKKSLEEQSPETPVRDHIWFRRLGETFAALGENFIAAKSYHISNKKRLNWVAVVGLANCLYDEDREVAACATLERAMEDGEFFKSLQLAEKITMLRHLSDWHEGLGNHEKALFYWNAIYKLSPSDPRAKFSLLKHYLCHGEIIEAKRIVYSIDDTIPEPTSGSSSPFGEMLDLIIEEEESSGQRSFFSLFLQVVPADQMDVLQREIDDAITAAKDAEKHHRHAMLLLYSGIVRYHRSTDNDQYLRLALSVWEECCSVALGKLSEYDRGRAHVLRAASLLLSRYHFNELRTYPTNILKQNTHLAELERIMIDYKPSSDKISAATCYLASYHKLQGNLGEAKKLFLADMTQALNLLRDGDTSNDDSGFYMLCSIILRTVDDQNAKDRESLAAFSLYVTSRVGRNINSILAELLQLVLDAESDPAHAVMEFLRCKYGPEEDPSSIVRIVLAAARELVTGDDSGKYEAYSTLLENLLSVLDRGWRFTCDLCRVKIWDFERNMHVCRFCYDTGFCPSCLDRVRTGELDRVICNQNHDWLTLPKWDTARWVKAFKREVQIPNHGETADPISTSAWLVEIVKAWELASGEEWDFALPV